MMLSRYSDCIGGLTSTFAVHVMVHNDAPDASGGILRWEVVDDLDGRSFFVGRGCSISFEGGNEHGVQEGVYFLDDRSFRSWMMIQHGGSAGRHFQVNDNGWWSMKTQTVTRFPFQCDYSDYSAPVWIRHGGSFSG
jgi:hypothetical protein